MEYLDIVASSIASKNAKKNGSKKTYVVQYGDTQEELLALLRQGDNLRYHLDNLPEQGKLTLSQPNPEPDYVIGNIFLLVLETDRTTDNIPDDLVDYYNSIAWSPASRVDPTTMYTPEVRAIMQDLLTTYKTLLREEELNPPEITPTSTTTDNDKIEGGNVTINPGTILNDVTFHLFGPTPNQITFTDTTKTDTTVNDTTDRTITLPGGLIVKLNDVLQVTDSLPDDTNTYFYRVSDYINPETGRLEDIPIPLYVCKNSEQVAFISTVDAETEAITSVQVASAEDDGWRTIGTLNNTGGIDWKYQVGDLTGSGTPSVVWHAQELGALGVWTDGTDNWTAIDGWFDAN